MSASEWAGFLVEDDEIGLPRLPHPADGRGPRHRPDVPFRFLQASDLRLDTPCSGITGLPNALHERLVDARYIAAERVFDAAIGYEVDFAILAGGLLDAGYPGVRGPWFLAEQFRRLAAHGIDIYWSGASLETRGRWPAQVDVPANVHRLTADETGILHGRNGHPVARLLTIPAHGSKSKLANGAFTIAVQPRCDGVPEHLRTGVDYWALGGQTDHETVQVGGVVAHFSGSPQGRTPAEVGRHSCSLVQVDQDGGVKIHPVLTDVVRWHQQRVTIGDDTSWSELEHQCKALQSQLPTNAGVDLHLVTWSATGEDPAAQQLLEPHDQAALIARLNADASSHAPAIWTVAINTQLDPQQRLRRQQGATPLSIFLQELDELAPQVPAMFGTVADGPHPLGAFGNEDCQQLVARVANEGAHRLGAEDHRLRRAG